MDIYIAKAWLTRISKFDDIVVVPRQDGRAGKCSLAMVYSSCDCKRYLSRK